jgi:sulfatase maturation enzyme AslB (radical SAM superfamily)
MPFFVAEAKRLVRDPAITDVQRVTLKYMLRHCVGAKNAQTIKTVVTYLNQHGCDVDIRSFQHQVLGWSRDRNNVYIASGRGGIYLIRNRADAEPMMDFYKNRIAAETHRLTRLIELTDTRWTRS